MFSSVERKDMCLIGRQVEGVKKQRHISILSGVDCRRRGLLIRVFPGQMAGDVVLASERERTEWAAKAWRASAFETGVTVAIVASRVATTAAAATVFVAGRAAASFTSVTTSVANRSLSHHGSQCHCAILFPKTRTSPPAPLPPL